MVIGRGYIDKIFKKKAENQKFKDKFLDHELRVPEIKEEINKTKELIKKVTKETNKILKLEKKPSFIKTHIISMFKKNKVHPESFHKEEKIINRESKEWKQFTILDSLSKILNEELKILNNREDGIYPDEKEKLNQFNEIVSDNQKFDDILNAYKKNPDSLEKYKNEIEQKFNKRGMENIDLRMI